MAGLKLPFIMVVFPALTMSFLNLGEEINESVICTKDLMEVEIPKYFFLTRIPPVYIRDLHLNDPECQGTETEDFYVFSVKTNLSDCGTLTDSDDVHIVFSNTIQNNNSGIITRTYINLTFACRYPLNYIVQQINADNKISADTRTITLNTEDGNFSIAMMLFKDENYTDKWTSVPFLSLEDNIYVKVTMIPTHLSVRLEKCWATPTNEPHHNTQYVFIKNSCPEVTTEHTLSVKANGQGSEARFRIQMFKFVGNSYNDIFLHCHVQICHSAVVQCKPNCSSFDEVARARRELASLHIVSYGPISRKSSNTKSANPGAVYLPHVETCILTGVLLVALITSAVLYKLWLRTERSNPATRVQLTLANFSHSEPAS
ncbi:pancreatic secretory granule membrane major glycoprotein GP2-like [Amblyraja radiata]|uniref:pancreatic secretory granule membrane major glycoprotein GP2-like n=1 Tax=Amblyraja radiata TaxID=386614 RepID=UPI0014040BF1|nr:pancreatic secretory granule membrane major glycoprotein GP2-like [Amblyraja radiata]